MRLWSLSPEYLDAKGLVALWREGLLAKKVLEGRTIGYKNHPQLNRFKAVIDPLASINVYLQAVVTEAERRGYAFDRSKISWDMKAAAMPVTSGQVEYGRQHLLVKLQACDPGRVSALIDAKPLRLNPLFNLIEGEVESWEIQ